MEEIFYFGVFIVLVIMVVKFFNIASDVRKLRTEANKDVKELRKDVRELKVGVTRYIKTHSNEIQPPAIPEEECAQLESNDPQTEKNSSSIFTEYEKDTDKKGYIFLIAAVIIFIIIIITAIYKTN